MRGTRTLALLLAAALGGSLPLTAGSASGRQGTLSRPLRSRGYPVQVYFSRHPVSEDHYGTVYPVRRVAPTLGVGAFALQQLFAGPRTAEAARGYYTEWPQTLQGPSSCGPLGFTLRLNRRGRAVEAGTATVQLCRHTRTGGVGASARMTAQTRATLLQFPTVRRVVLLTAAGVCFGDLSGLNRCLRPAPAAATTQR